MFIYSPYIKMYMFFEIGVFNKHFEYSLRSIMIAHCGCAVKNKVVDSLYCAVVMRQSSAE